LKTAPETVVTADQRQGSEQSADPSPRCRFEADPIARARRGRLSQLAQSDSAGWGAWRANGGGWGGSGGDRKVMSGFRRPSQRKRECHGAAGRQRGGGVVSVAAPESRRHARMRVRCRHLGRCGLGVLACSGLLLMAAPAAAPSQPTSCLPQRSRTVLATSTARVFSTSRSASENLRVYGCLYRVGRPFLLVRDFEVEFGSAITNVKLADPYVGFGFLLSEAEFGSVAHVRVVNLANGRREHDSLATGKFFSDVFDLELTRAGTIAWIARAYDDTEGEPVPAGCKPRSRFLCDYPYEVRKSDDHRPVLLDRGHQVSPRSLQLGRGTVTWFKAGALRTANLTGALPSTGFPITRLALGGFLLLVVGVSLRISAR
jgi:hypothetical protein